MSGNAGSGGLTGVGSGFDSSGSIALDLVAASFSGDLPQDVFPTDSPVLVDTADPGYLAQDDFNGLLRGSNADIGAYRHVAGGNPGWTLAEDFKELARDLRRRLRIGRHLELALTEMEGQAPNFELEIGCLSLYFRWLARNGSMAATKASGVLLHRRVPALGDGDKAPVGKGFGESPSRLGRQERVLTAPEHQGRHLQSCETGESPAAARTSL